MRTDRSRAAAMALLLGVVVAPSVWAVEYETAKSPAAKPATPAAPTVPVMMNAEGSVSGLDLKAGTLTLAETAGKSWTLAIETPGTAVWKASRYVPLSELKTGDHVKVLYVSKDGKMIARSIDVQTAAASSQTPAAAPATQQQK